VLRAWRAWIATGHSFAGLSSGDVHRMHRGVRSELEVSGTEDPGPAEWLEPLPYPLASVLQALHGTARPEGAA